MRSRCLPCENHCFSTASAAVSPGVGPLDAAADLSSGTMLASPAISSRPFEAPRTRHDVPRRELHGQLEVAESHWSMRPSAPASHCETRPRFLRRGGATRSTRARARRQRLPSLWSNEPFLRRSGSCILAQRASRRARALELLLERAQVRAMSRTALLRLLGRRRRVRRTLLDCSARAILRVRISCSRSLLACGHALAPCFRRA